jgi:hypothetical protein
VNEETLRWLSGLRPGDIGAYAALVILLVLLVWGIHTDNFVFGPRWRDKVEECKTCKQEKEAISQSLAKANETIRSAEKEDNAKLNEILRLRMEREFQWRTPSQQGNAQ